MGIGMVFSFLFGWAFNLIPYSNAKNWLAIYTDPSDTINKEIPDASLVQGLLNILISTTIYLIGTSIVTFIVNLLLSLVYSSKSLVGVGIFGFVVSTIFSIIIFIPALLVISLIATGIVWLIAKLLGGKGSFTTQHYIASLIIAGGAIIITVIQVLNSIISLIPIVNFIVFLILLVLLVVYLYQLYLHILAVNKIHNVSMLKAAISIFLPIVIAIGIFVLIFLSFVALLGEAWSQMFLPR